MPPSSSGVVRASEPLPATAQGRQRAREQMALQHRRLGELEAALGRQMGHISQELALGRKANLDTEAELLESRADLEAAAKKLRLDERGLAQLRRECEANAEESAYHRQRAQQKLAELESQRENLDQLEMDLKDQRRRIAHELKAQRENNRRQFERQLAEIDGRREALGDAEAAAGQLAEANRRLAELEAELAAERKRPSAAESLPESGEALADMKRRYELAMEDLREQKRRVAELEKQPAAAARPAAAAADHGGKLDWESQKQKMLAALEADADAEDEVRQEEQLKIRDVIARTDAALAEKDQEIDELKRLLEAQSANLGEVAVGAAAFADLLSGDEVVRNERERLQQLQREWEEKLRQAEIDLSVQRAKLGRERAEIEERQRSFHQQQAEHGGGGDQTTPLKPQRGRWLARLGLKEDES